MRRMEYKVTIQRELFILFISLTLLLLTLGWEYISLRFLCLFMLEFQLIVLFIKYSFTIEEDKVIYTMFFARFPIYKKKATLAQIKMVVFKRVN